MIDPYILAKMSGFNHKERLEQAARDRLVASVYQAPSRRERISQISRLLLARMTSASVINDTKLITSEHRIVPMS